MLLRRCLVPLSCLSGINQWYLAIASVPSPPSGPLLPATSSPAQQDHQGSHNGWGCGGQKGDERAGEEDE